MSEQAVTPVSPLMQDLAAYSARIRLHYLEGMDRKSCPAVVCCGGRMDFHGAPLSRAWVKLGATARKGEAAVTLAEPGQGWKAGDRVIDWVIEFLCAIPGAMILGPEFLKLAISVAQGNEPDIEQLDYQRLALGVAVLAAAWLALLAVQVWMLATRGQSIGKRIMRIRIVRVEDGSNAGFVHAWVMRELLITAIGISLGMIPFLGLLLRPAFHIVDWCLIFRDNQACLHDQMAKTKVVKA